MNPLLPLLTAFATGFAHALAPDHVAAVGTFVSRRPQPGESLRFGARWGFGHSLSVMLAGGVLILLDLRVSERVAQNLERGVGAMLFALGAWLLWSLAHERAHARGAALAAEAEPAIAREGDTVETATEGRSQGGPVDRHRDRSGSLVVGMAHGLAGSAPLIGVIPLAFIEPGRAAFLYLGLFSLGTVAAMALFAGVAGFLLHATDRTSPHLALGLRFATALGSATLGAMWFLNA